MVDYPTDPSCSDFSDDSEAGVITVECNDGTDNDSDGDTDYPDDLGCDSAVDTSEAGGERGGGMIIQPETEVLIEGRAWPGAEIEILRDGIIVARGQADSSGYFSISDPELAAGVYTYGFRTRDPLGARSSANSVTVSVPADQTTRISGVNFHPTVVVPSQIVLGTDLPIQGYFHPGATFSLIIGGMGQSLSIGSVSGGSGLYTLSGNTSSWPEGTYSILVSISGYPIRIYVFQIGSELILLPSVDCPGKGDLNGDCRVDIVDFSIISYWWDKPLDRAFLNKESIQLSGDGKVGLTDLSIMAFNWTG